MACSNGLLEWQYMSDMTAYALKLGKRVDLLYVVVLYLSEKELMNTEDIKLLVKIVRNSPELTQSVSVYRSMPEKNHLKNLGPWIQEKTGIVNFNISFSTDAFIEAGDYHIDENDSQRVLTRKGYLEPLEPAPKRNIHFETTRHYVKPTPTAGYRPKTQKRIQNQRIERGVA